MATRVVATTDVVAIGVTVVATLVVVALVASLWYLLWSARRLRREAEALAREAHELLDDLDDAVRQAGAEVDRVDRLVGSAEAISEAVGSASRLLGGALAEPVIKLVALASGIARAVKAMRGGGRKVIPASSRERDRRRLRSAPPRAAREVREVRVASEAREAREAMAEPRGRDAADNGLGGAGKGAAAGQGGAAFGRPGRSRGRRAGLSRHLHSMGTSGGPERRPR